MTDRASQLQIAFVARAIGDAGVKATAAKTPAGAAIFAKNAFPTVFPRGLVDPPQRVPDRATDVEELFVTFHAFATGAEASLEVQALTNAVRESMRAPLAVNGFEVATQTFEGSRPAGDPDENVEHLVSTFRFLVGPSA